jgi:NTE family protein
VEATSVAEATPDVAAFLARVPLFAALVPNDMDRVLDATAMVTLAAGEFLCFRGEEGDALYIVESGLLEAVIDEGTASERVMSTFAAGAHVGEMALLTGEPRSASVRARTPSRVLVLAKPRFEQLLDEVPAIAVRLCEVLSARLAEMNEHLSHQTSRVGVVVCPGDPARAIPLLLALGASFDRQFRRPCLLVLCDMPALHPDAPPPGRPDLARLFDAIGTSPTGGAYSSLDLATVQQATEPEMAQALGSLRRRFGHVLVAMTARCALLAPVGLARADHVCLLARPADSASDIETLGDRLAPICRHFRLAFVDGRGHAAPQMPPAALPPLRLESDEPLSRSGAAAPPALRADVDRLARALAGASLGLALSGGAAQGVAHLGVLQALIEAGVPIDLIAGTSGGSLYGSLLASGMPIQAAQDAVIARTRRNLLDRADFTLPRRGVIRGARIAEMIRGMLGEVTFDALRFPLYAVAVDLDTGQEVVLDQGTVYQAIRASISVPGIFEPYRLGDRVLVDGGVVNPMPVDVARRMGADFVVAVQVPAPGKTAERSGRHVSRQLGGGHNLVSTIVRSYYFSGDILARRGASEANVLIRPAVAHFGWRDYRAAPAIIRAGVEAGHAAVEQIAAVLPVSLAPPAGAEKGS